MENKDIIAKADLVLSDIASAGKLNPEQTNRFIRVLIEQPTLLNSVRTVTMNAPVQNINKIGFGSRILRPAVENTALIQADRAKPTFSQIQLVTSEVMATVYIPYAVLEDNIEGGTVNTALQQGGGGLHQTIVDLLAERAALDLEELCISGDTGSGDAYLALQDGYLKRLTSGSNVVDASSATYSKELVKAAMKAMPPKYLRDSGSMKHFVSSNNEIEMRDIYANRIGALGDANVQSKAPITVFGSPITGVPLMPGTSGIFCNPNNLIFGIQRNIMVEYDKDIETRQFKVVLTARVALSIEEKLACVKTINMTA